jgi:predicted lipoprotein with Yx(FWY)xxD motif
MMRRTSVLALVLAALSAAVALGAGTASGHTTSRPGVRAVVVSTRLVPELGVVLVDSKRRTLYMFVPDKRKRVTCVRVCAAVWPPVKLAKGAKLVATAGAKVSLLGSDPDPSGGRVVTYNRWPLYTYVADRAPGQAKGQALDLNGGLWYVVSPSGKVIRRKP